MGGFYSAGGVFMTPLSAIGLVAVLLAGKKIYDLYIKAGESPRKHRPMINLVLQLGVFSFFLGILSQAIGLIQAFQVIEQVGAVSPSMLAGGLKVSMIAPIYGLIILIVTFIAWSILKYRIDQDEEQEV